jgi:hypothetical protein
VSILYLDARERGTIVSVSHDGRAFDVETDDGALVTFKLNPATARFTAGRDMAGARARFDRPAAS